jgi:hypothetical protein
MPRVVSELYDSTVRGAVALRHQSMTRVHEALLAMGVPCFLSGMARGLLGRNASIHIRQNRKQALMEVRT